MFKRIAWIAAAALSLAAGPAFGQARDKVVLLLNWYVYSEHAPFFLGVERGYFAQEGIDLDIQEGRGSGVTVQAVAAGTATFGYADIPTIVREKILDIGYDSSKKGFDGASCGVSVSIGSRVL